MSKDKLGLGYSGHLGHIGHIEHADMIGQIFGDVKLKGCDIVIAETIKKEKYNTFFNKRIFIIGQSNLVRKYSYEDFIKHHKDILDKVSKLSSTERRYIIQTYEKIYLEV
jgi:hypothetical protein